MKINGQREFDLLKKIGFIRTAGTEEELKAANILTEEIKEIGLTPSLQSFQVEDGETITAELEVLEPYNKKYEVTAYKCCKDADNIIGDLIYIENATDAALKEAKGKFVLVNGFMRLPLFRKLIEAKVLGFITMSGTLLETPEDSDLFTRKIRSVMKKFGNLPALNIRTTDAFELVKDKASKVKINIKNKDTIITSHNLISEIKGTDYPDEIISFGAHYDSVPFSTGVYDNGAGSVIIMELLRHFKENPPKRTLKFCWYGAEEIGLEGSKAFVRDNNDELENHIFMINVDVAGPVLGFDKCHVTAGEDLKTYCEYFMKIGGYGVEISKGVASSDSTPFADAGIPAVNFNRDGAPGGAFIHCRHDVIHYLSAEALEKTTQHILHFSDSLVNSKVFPVKKEIPEDIRKELDKYLFINELKELDNN